MWCKLGRNLQHLVRSVRLASVASSAPAFLSGCHFFRLRCWHFFKVLPAHLYLAQKALGLRSSVRSGPTTSERFASGTLVHWYAGTLVHWYAGTLVHWYIGPCLQRALRVMRQGIYGYLPSHSSHRALAQPIH